MPSRKSEEIPAFIVMDVLDRACVMDRSGADVVHMEVGEPDFPTPRKIIEAGHRALDQGYTHYTHSLGDPDLREALSRFYRKSYGVDAPPGRVLCTMGSSPAMLLVFAALLDAGDEVILPDPGYACTPNMIRYVGGVPVPVKVREEEGFQYDPAEIRRRIGPRTKAIVVNSPANPTGCVTSSEVLREIAGLGPRIVSDEIYHGMTYEGECRSMLEYAPDAFVLGGFSKRWAMTGWRLGWAVAPQEFVRPMQKLQQNFFISPSAFAQRAGIVALDEEHPEIAEMIRVYDERRRFLVPELRRLGFGVPCMPRGAFYVFANVSRFTRDCYRFAFEILEKARVAVTPGVDFGRSGEGYIRFSYANSLERIREGMRRLETFLQDRPALPPGEPAPAAADAAPVPCAPGPAPGAGRGGLDEARELVREFLKPGADRAELSRRLQPTREDGLAVFDPEFAAKAEAAYAPAWQAGKMVVTFKPGQTQVLVWGATSEELKAWTEDAAEHFPGGYREAAARFRPGVTVYAFKFVQPGETAGMSYDGLVFVNGAWRIFPKPFRLL